MIEKRSDNRTKNALLARGLDSTTVDRLVEQGHTVGMLQSLALDQLLSLGLDEWQARSFAASGRPPIPEDALNTVLYKSRWTCCICRDSSKGIIVHHLDQWSSSKSHAEENLVVLCLDHHGEAHTKRELSLSLSADRIRQARDRWYADAPEASQQEAAKIVKLIRNDHRLMSVHRGAMSWGENEVAVYGNDGYGRADAHDLGPIVVRTRRQIELLRMVLAQDAIQELAFSAADDGGTWVLLVRSEDANKLSAILSACFVLALEEQTGERYRV